MKDFNFNTPTLNMETFQKKQKYNQNIYYLPNNTKLNNAVYTLREDLGKPFL